MSNCGTETDACNGCGLVFGATRADGSSVTESLRDDDTCSRCAPCRKECSCDSEEEHYAAVERSRLEFLRDPGPTPADWDAERTQRVYAAIEQDRIASGVTRRRGA